MNSYTWGAAPMQVDLEALWRDLGVERNGLRAALNDEAPLAAIRRAITEQEILTGALSTTGVRQ